MLSLKKSEFPRHADYVRESRTCVIKSKVNTSDLQMGYLATLDSLKVCPMMLFVDSTSLKSVRDGILVDHLGLIPW